MQMNKEAAPDFSDQEHLEDFERMLSHARELDTGSYRVLSYEHFFRLPSLEQQALYDDLVMLQHA
jgi:hypothetical protein